MARHEYARQLRQARIEQNMTQGELAEKMDIHHSAVNRLERGHTWPTVRTLMEWANALGFSLALVKKSE